jgi:hypothetical protein
MGRKMKPSTPKLWSALVPLISAVVAAGSAFVYFNVNVLERAAAETDGVPMWSVHQVPYTLPFALAGAAIGIALRWCWARWRQRI